MKTYPEVVTDEMLSQYAGISDSEILIDIVETEREIDGYRKTMEAERELSHAHPVSTERRMADFKASARLGQIAEREAFVAFLRRVQAARARAGTRG